MEENQGKIRKRGCSSSSSSSLVRKYRLKRAILVGKQTPKLRSPVSVAAAAAAAEGKEIDLLKFPTGSGNGRDGVVSARRLAATLWEINQVSSPPQASNEKASSRTTRESRMRETVVMPVPCSDLPSDALPEVEGSGFDGHRRRKSVPESQKLLLLAEEEGDALFTNGRLSEEMETRPQFKDVRKALATAKELLKVLSHIWGRHSSAAKSLVSSLQVEIDSASIQVDQLAYEHRSYRREMRYQMQHFAEEKDKIRRVAELAGAELEAERKLRRQTEKINKKLGRELADKKVRLDLAVKELAKEKWTNEELEHVCEDREEVEELKRASAEAWEEVEMLQLADVLREERVQMKLAEAKYHFEEKNADIEKLRSELEAYMSNNHVVTKDADLVHEGEDSPGSANSEVLRDFLQKTLGKVCQNPNIEDHIGREDENHDSSSDSDMHSIELELDGSKKSFKWGYSPPTQQDDSKRSSVEVFKGRKSLSEKIQWATISLLKGSSTSKTDNTAAAPIAPLPQNNETHDVFQKSRPSSSGSHCRNKDQVADENARKEHKSVTSLKKKILSSFKLGSSLGYTSPAKQWGQAIERF